MKDLSKAEVSVCVLNLTFIDDELLRICFEKTEDINIERFGFSKDSNISSFLLNSEMQNSGPRTILFTRDVDEYQQHQFRENAER
jgi:hypothetical protein